MYLDNMMSAYEFRKVQVPCLKFGGFLPVVPLRTLVGDPKQCKDLTKELGMDPRTPWWRVIGPAC